LWGRLLTATCAKSCANRLIPDRSLKKYYDTLSTAIPVLTKTNPDKSRHFGMDAEIQATDGKQSVTQVID
jgi:hypothetical protein